MTPGYDQERTPMSRRIKQRLFHRKARRNHAATSKYCMDFTAGQYDVWRVIIIEIACTQNDWAWRRNLRLVCRAFDKIIKDNRAAIACCYEELRILKFRNKIKFNDIQMGSNEAIQRFLQTELTIWRNLKRLELDIIDIDLKISPLHQGQEIFDFNQILFDVAFNLHECVRLEYVDARLSPIGHIDVLYPILANHCQASLKSLLLTSIKFSDEPSIQQFLTVLRSMHSLEEFGATVILQPQFTRAESMCGDIVTSLEQCWHLSNVKLSIDDAWNVRSEDLCHLLTKHDLRHLTVTSVGPDVVANEIFQFPNNLNIDRFQYLERVQLNAYHVNTLPGTNASTLLWQQALLIIARHCIKLRYFQLTLETYITTSGHALSLETFLNVVGLLLNNAGRDQNNIVVRLSAPLLDQLHQADVDERLLDIHAWDATCIMTSHRRISHSFKHLTVVSGGSVEFCTTQCRMVETEVKRSVDRAPADRQADRPIRQRATRQSWLERIVSR